MRLQSFRLMGFRSVEDSRTVHVARDITILAGKNESGKSALLEGLAALLSDEQKDLGSDYTIDYNGRPRLSARFEATDHEVRKMYEIAGQENISVEPDMKIIELVSTEKDYAFDCLLLEWMDRHTTKLEEQIAEICDRVLADDPEYTGFDGDVVGLVDKCNQKFALVISQPGDRLGDEGEATPKVTDHRRLTDLFEAWQENREKRELVHEALVSFMPTVIHFSSFDDLLPDQLSLVNEEAAQQRIVQDFCALTGLDLKRLIGTNDSFERRHIVEDSLDAYTTEFGKYWHQERLIIGPEVDGDQLLFTVKAVGEKKSYRPSQRSRGLQWYLSFFITLTARNWDVDTGLILIDEPGLYLHAKAQEEVAAVLEAMCKDGHQVIIGTHSPYLMQAERLDRIRLVIKDEKTKRTTVHPTWYTGADRETLTPILTAIGLDGIRTFPGLAQKNVVVEGPSDYYYLQAMRHWFYANGEDVLSGDIAFVPCLGHANVGLVVSLLLGWGRECVVILDKKGTSRTRRLLVEQGFPAESILTLGANDNESLVDLFSPSDQQDILGNVKLSAESRDPVSQRIKSIAGVSETILARQFFDKVLSGEKSKFTNKTSEKFREVFEQIERSFTTTGSLEVAVSVEER